MVLYLVGLGLGDEQDITVRGLAIVRKCHKVYLEHYTSILGIDVKRLEAFYERDITLADRFMVESHADTIVSNAIKHDIALLVVGDPLCATTHTDMMLRAKEAGVVVRVVHNTSVMGAVASCGLQLYQFGQTISICFFEGNWRPDSFYDKIKYNQLGKMHTLCLLDIKVKEPDMQAMMQNKTVFLPPRFMTVNQAVEQLLEVEEKRREGVCGPTAQAIGVARLGQSNQAIYAGTLEELRYVDFGGPLHSLVLCGELHDLEIEFLKHLRPPLTAFFNSPQEKDGACGFTDAEETEDEPTSQAPVVHTDYTEQQGPSVLLDEDGSPLYTYTKNYGDHNHNNGKAHEIDDEDLFELTGIDPGAVGAAFSSDEEED